jgi:ABC-type transport system involved in cytochrome c biogenesis permease subunit
MNEKSATASVMAIPGRVKIGRVLPLILPFVLAGFYLMLGWRGIIPLPPTETALVVLAVIGYAGAAILFLASLFVHEAILERAALVTTAVGFGLNVAAWGTRGLIVGHYPLSNLYDTSLFFALATAGASLLVTAVSGHRFAGVLTMPVAILLLVLALLYGNEARDLPPVLVSVWRPIHVTLAMVGYAACAVSFATALLYLLKDGVRFEIVALCAMAVVALTDGFLSGGAVVGRGVFYANFVIGGERIPLDPEGKTFLHTAIPVVGHLFRLAFVAAVMSAAAFGIGCGGADRFPKIRRFGYAAAWTVGSFQLAGLGVLLFRLKSPSRAVELIDPSQRAVIPPAWLQQFGSRLELHVRGNALEIAAVVAALALTAFVVVFGWNRERILAVVPSLDALDHLTYRAVAVAFPLLTLMIVTGAIWANQSWGRYWAWDPKETWALITWLIYALFLHTRLTHGWRGRRAALFAVIGFIAVMFTYLGVSFILPGLHSYA